MDRFVFYCYNRHLRVWVVSILGVKVCVKPKDFKNIRSNLDKLSDSYDNMTEVLRKNGIVW